MIHRLYAYFASKYDQQRKSLILALALILLSLLVIAVRYCTEFYLFKEEKSTDFENVSLKVSMIIFLLTLSDFLPICSQIAVIWISSRNNWNKLIQDYLRPFNENDLKLPLNEPMLTEL